MITRRLLSGIAASSSLVLALIAAPAASYAASPMEYYEQTQPVYVSADGIPQASTDFTAIFQKVSSVQRNASTQAASISPKISCNNNNPSVRQCTLAVAGGYCGSSRQVGAGITTMLKGGMVTAPVTRSLNWNAHSTAQSYMLVLGTTGSATFSLQGQGSDTPYATCSL